MGVMAAAAGAWLASVLFTSMANTQDRAEEGTEREPHVLMVQSTDDDATAATAVVVDDEGHLAASSKELRPNSTVRVLCGDKYRKATVVEHDAETGLAILKLDEPFGTPSEATSVKVGDPINVVAYSPDGARSMRPATVVSGLQGASAEQSGLDPQVASTAVSAADPGDAPVSGTPGGGEVRVMAIREPNPQEPGATQGAVTASGGQVVGLIVAEGPVAGMVEPLNEVRRRAAQLLSD